MNETKNQRHFFLSLKFSLRMFSRSRSVSPYLASSINWLKSAKQQISHESVKRKIAMVLRLTAKNVAKAGRTQPLINVYYRKIQCTNAAINVGVFAYSFNFSLPSFFSFYTFVYCSHVIHSCVSLYSVEKYTFLIDLNWNASDCHVCLLLLLLLLDSLKVADCPLAIFL